MAALSVVGPPEIVRAEDLPPKGSGVLHHLDGSTAWFYWWNHDLAEEDPFFPVAVIFEGDAEPEGEVVIHIYDDGELGDALGLLDTWGYDAEEFADTNGLPFAGDVEIGEAGWRVPEHQRSEILVKLYHALSAGGNSGVQGGGVSMRADDPGGGGGSGIGDDPPLMPDSCCCQGFDGELSFGTDCFECPPYLTSSEVCNHVLCVDRSLPPSEQGGETDACTAVCAGYNCEGEEGCDIYGVGPDPCCSDDGGFVPPCCFLECDDGDPCNGEEYCDHIPEWYEEGFGCESESTEGCDDDNPCTIDSCEHDGCEYESEQAGTWCGNCKRCQGGACVSDCAAGIERCCGGDCCPTAQACCDGICCAAGQTCCDGRCCAGTCCGEGTAIEVCCEECDACQYDERGDPSCSDGCPTCQTCDGGGTCVADAAQACDECTAGGQCVDGACIGGCVLGSVAPILGCPGSNVNFELRTTCYPTACANPDLVVTVEYEFPDSAGWNFGPLALPCPGPQNVPATITIGPDAVASQNPYHITVTAVRAGLSCAQQITVNVRQPNLTVSGVPEEKEFDPGGFIRRNNDDDNHDAIPDLEQTSPGYTVPGENDTLFMSLQVGQRARNDTVTLDRQYHGQGQIRVFEVLLNPQTLVPYIEEVTVYPHTCQPLQPGAYIIEGTVASSTPHDVSFILTHSSPGGTTCEDEVRLSVVEVDLDVDSDNTAGLDAPERTEAEDRIEDWDGNGPGKYLQANWDNDDQVDFFWNESSVLERIPDGCDGYNLDGVGGNDDDVCDAENDFVPFVLQLPAWLDRDVAYIRFTYPDSPPLEVAFSDADAFAPPNLRDYESNGGMRIWTLAGSVVRNGADVAAGGQFLSNGTAYRPTDLGFTSDRQTLYLEGIAPLESAPYHDQILVQVDPDGAGPVPFLDGDSVRITVVQVVWNSRPEGDELSEFDFATLPRGFIVPLPAGGQTDIRVEVAGDAPFMLENINPDKATIPGDSGPPGGPWTGWFYLPVTSVSEGDTAIKIRLATPDRQEIGIIWAAVRPRRNVFVRFHAASDTAGHASQLTFADTEAIMDRLNEIWNRKANIYFQPSSQGLFVVDPPVQGDLGCVVQFFDADDGATPPTCTSSDDSDWDLVVRAGGKDPNAFNIIQVWELEIDCPPDENCGADDIEAATGYWRECLGDENVVESHGKVYSHEVGHFFCQNAHFLHDRDEHGQPITPYADCYLFKNKLNL